MKINDVYRLLIKLFGLFFLAYSIYTILPILAAYMAFGATFPYLITSVLQIVITIIIFWLMILKTDWLIHILKLDQGFSKDLVELKDMHKEPVMDLAIVLIGGCVMVKYIPLFLGNLYFSFQTSAGINDVSDSYKADMKIHIATNLLGIIIGYILITNRRKCIKLLKLDSKEKTNED